MIAIKILLCITAIWIALGLACALRVGCRRRTGDNQVAADPFFFPFGDMPTVPQERHSFLLSRTAKFVMTGSSPPPLGEPISRRLIFIPHPAGLALRTDAGSDGPSFPSGPVAVRTPVIDARIEHRKTLSLVELSELRRTWDNFHG